MGYYINPSEISKEEWLFEHGEPIHKTPLHAIDGDRVVVCLVNNGAFTAAGIAYDDDELAAFARPDGRGKLWFTVPIDLVEEFCPRLKQRKE